MPVHIFVINEENFDLCIKKGLAAIPSANSNHINDALISRIIMISKDDYILFYLKGKKEIRGVYKAIDEAFYDDTEIWPIIEDQKFPFRVRFDNTEYTFERPISLSDVFDMKDSNYIWTFTLSRPNGTANAIFSISDIEYRYLFDIFLKVNPLYMFPQQIKEPYKYIKPNLLDMITFEDGLPKYEYSLMALLINDFSNKKHFDLFGVYSDFLSYIPTSFGKEIDLLLFHSHPLDKHQIIGYSIIEVKRDEFKKDGLFQLFQYEDWFLKKRVNGDYHMIRTIAIAKSFSNEVIEYLKKKKEIEDKEILLLKYSFSEGKLLLEKEAY
jgi:hypothetical protein